MAMIDYGPPVDQLTKLGDVSRGDADDWLDYPAMGLGPGDVPELIRMAVDPRWDLDPSEAPEVWSPIHAWRALGQLKAEAAVGPLADILADQEGDDWNDWATEELPEVIGMIGPVAIPELRSRLEAGESLGEYVGTYFSRSLREIGRRHPEARDECVAILTRVLERAEGNDPALNGFVISDLVDLGASESAGAIERAYAGEFVDDSIMGTWHDVWHRLDLEGEPPPETEPLYRLFRSLVFEPPPPFQGPSPAGWQPVERRTPIERKDRNKARQKLEKKAKGKKGKRR